MKNLICIICFITFFYSLPAQTHWVATNSRDTFDNLALHSKGDTLFASIGGVGIYITADNGNNWFKKNNGLPNTFVVTLVSNNQYLFAGTYSGSNGGVFRSADNGENWERVVNGLPTTQINVLTFKGDTLLAGTSRSIYYSLNNGDEWIKASTPYNLNITAIYAEDSLIIGFDGRDMFRSADNGTTWKDMRTNMNGDKHKIVRSGSRLFITSTGWGFFKSDDWGNTWDSIGVGVIRNASSLLAYDTLLFVGENYDGVYKSADKGQTWEKFGEGLPSTYYRAIEIHKGLLFANTDGKKIWRRALNETSAVQKVTPLNLQMTLYPNPTNQFATLQYNLEEKSFITIALSDINGRIIKQLSNGVQSAGKQEFNFSVKELIPGNYFCTLSVNSQIASILLQILR